MNERAAIFANTKQPQIFAALLPILDGSLAGCTVELHPGRNPSIRWMVSVHPVVVLTEQGRGAHVFVQPNVIFDKKVESSWRELAGYHDPEAMNCLLFKDVPERWPPALARVLELAVPALRRVFKLPAAEAAPATPPPTKSAAKPAPSKQPAAKQAAAKKPAAKAPPKKPKKPTKPANKR